MKRVSIFCIVTADEGEIRTLSTTLLASIADFPKTQLAANYVEIYSMELLKIC
ncbi:MAG: hypothetical protein JW701_05315 [Kosmotogaceae bacterium]|nr:hypothetical protein [Kosmotogaceae bacterium]